MTLHLKIWRVDPKKKEKNNEEWNDFNLTFFFFFLQDAVVIRMTWTAGVLLREKRSAWLGMNGMEFRRLLFYGVLTVFLSKR